MLPEEGVNPILAHTCICVTSTLLEDLIGTLDGMPWGIWETMLGSFNEILDHSKLSLLIKYLTFCSWFFFQFNTIDHVSEIGAGGHQRHWQWFVLLAWLLSPKCLDTQHKQALSLHDAPVKVSQLQLWLYCTWQWWYRDGRQEGICLGIHDQLCQ